MYMADTTVLSGDKYPEVFEQMEKDLRLSKNLYNAALFRIRQVFTGWDKEQRTENEEEVFREKGLVIMEMNGEADHVHVLFEADPFTAPGSLVNIIKTKTSRFARREYGETVLKKYYWKPYFWSDSYFVTTVSENSLAVVQDYIRNQ